MATRNNLTRQQAADELQVSTKTIDRLREAGELEEFAVGRCVRIVTASLDAYQRRQKLRSKREPSIEELFPIPRLDQIRAEKAAARANDRARDEEAA